MHKTVSTTIAAIAAFILVLCIAFSAVKITAQNTSFFEEEFIKLELDKATGISISDLSKSLQNLVGYMNKNCDSIDTEIMLNGQKVQMFVLDIEHVHMTEVKTLWQRFIGMRSIGLILCGLLFCFAVMTDKKKYQENLCLGYLWGFGVFLLFAAFAGTWAGLNFNSFWNYFHRLIFPNSDNWLLPSSSRMIQMLPSALFSDVVRRCGITLLLPAFILAGAAITGLILLGSDDKKVVSVSQEKESSFSGDEEIIIGEPDLVFVHKKVNMPVSLRKQLEKEMEAKDVQEAKATLIHAEEEESQGEDPGSASSDEALKVVFEPYTPDPDDEEQESDEE